MVFVDLCILLLMCQASSVRPNGISLPITSLTFKSMPTDKKSLTVSFSPNNYKEPLPPYKENAETIQSVNSLNTYQAPCISSESSPQPNNLATATKLPVKTVSISAPLNPVLEIDPHLQKIMTSVQNQVFTPNIAITSQISVLPQINLSNLESTNLVNSNVNLNDCKEKVVPPVVQSAPSYFVNAKDINYRSGTCPVTTVKLNNLPYNIYKVKIADSRPIFIDCSKPVNSNVPVITTSVNPTEIKISEKINYKPKSQIMQNILADTPPNQVKEEIVIPQASSAKITSPSISFHPPINQQCTNTAINNAQTTNTITPTPSGKVVCPLSNVIFNYNSNIISQMPTEKTPTCSTTQPKVAPLDNKVELTIKPYVSIADSELQLQISAQNNIQSPYNINSNCNDFKPISKSESTYSKLPSSSCLYNQAYNPEIEVPVIPISNLPNVYTNSKITTTQPPILRNTSQDPKIFKSTSDVFASRLSSSLNNIISLLTAGILSKLFDKKSPQKSIVDIVPIKTNEVVNFNESNTVTNTLAPINLDMPSCLPNPEFVSSPPSVIPDTLPIPTVDKVVNDLISHINSEISSILCPEKASRCKPYLSSVTINIMPSKETSNDILIMI